ncbi:MAG: phosphotransferase [Myxococcota bacterium]|nr:phosphotransferase [Myxococcota bacterium]
MIDALQPSLKHWPFLSGMTATQIEGGLINATWSVGQPPVAVVQQLSPIFSPELHRDIEAITAHVAAKGLMTPRLLRTADNQLFHTDNEGVTWRCMNWIAGVSHHRMLDAEMAAQAGGLVARWHRAVDDLEHEFAFSRPEAHDTPLHMQFVEGALMAHPQHRLLGEVEPLASSILEAWGSWDGDLEGGSRICHGDLKVSNIRFSESGEALCLLDLDTLSFLPLEVELGDAFRSW